MTTERAEDEAKDAIVAAACDWTGAHAPEERGEADRTLRAAVVRYEVVRTHARPAQPPPTQDDALRAALLRYGRALQIVRGRAGSIVDVDVAAYDEWTAALEVLDARALALAAAAGPG